MRILMTGDTAGGVFTFVTELAAGLVDRGHTVTLATFGPEPSHPLNDIRWFHHTGKLEWQEDPWTDIQHASAWLRSLVAQEGPELIHMNTLCHGDLGWNVPVITTVHSCVLTWWEAVRKSPIPVSWDRYRRMAQSSLQASAVLITPTAALREALTRAWPLDASIIQVIPNGRSASLFHALPKETFLICAGRLWDEAKNIQALNQIATQIPWTIYVAGEGDNTNACRFLGALKPDELAAWFARAAIYVSPALYEPFGLAILEAALSGCALVLNDIPSLREVWQDAAVFANPNEFPKAIADLMQKPEDMQRRALERARHFTRTKMVSRYLSVYDQARSYACAS